MNNDSSFLFWPLNILLLSSTNLREWYNRVYWSMNIILIFQWIFLISEFLSQPSKRKSLNMVENAILEVWNYVKNLWAKFPWLKRITCFRVYLHFSKKWYTSLSSWKGYAIFKLHRAIKWKNSRVFSKVVFLTFVS